MRRLINMDLADNRFKIFLAIIISLVFCAGSYILVSAGGYSGFIYGRASWHGYFQNIRDTNYPESGSGDDPYVLSVKSGGLAIPYDIDTYEELINLLRDYNDGGTAKNKTGSAFIVNTMLGRDGPGSNTDVSDSDWNTLTAILKDRSEKGKIVWNGNVDNAPANINSYYQGVGSGSNPNDDAFYAKYKNEAGIKIINDDGSSYQLLRRCANPVGILAGLSAPLNWNINAVSAVRVNSDTEVNTGATAVPGDTIHWTHNIYNMGPSDTTLGVSSYINATGFYNDFGDNAQGGSTLTTLAGAAASNSTPIRTIDGYHIYTVRSEDAGKKLCETAVYSPIDNSGSGSGNGNESCVTIGYKFSLTPSVTTDHSGVVEAGSSFKVSPVVSNSGPSISKSSSWRLMQIIAQPGFTADNLSGGTSSSEPCSYYDNANANCTTVASGDSKVFNVGSSSLSVYSGSVGDLAVGTKVCFALSVMPYSDSSNNWNNSSVICMIVGKRPKVQILGGNLLTGGSTQTSTSVKDSHMFGSWTEYAIFSAGTIKGTASGSAFSGVGLNNAKVCDYSTLSFTSAGSDTCSNSTTKGKYVSSNYTPDIAASFTGDTATISANNIVVNDLMASSGLYVGSRTGDLTLNSSEIAPGKSIVLKVSGTVVIAGDITYNSDNYGAKYTNINQLPQLVIIANKIIVNSNVTNIDAWLVASGNDGIIETCNTGSSTYALSGAQRLTINKCNSKLTVNGPVIAKQLWLRRTAGSGTGLQSGDPAEVFNLRADVYLWSASQASSSLKIQTVYKTELPARF